MTASQSDNYDRQVADAKRINAAGSEHARDVQNRMDQEKYLRHLEVKASSRMGSRKDRRLATEAYNNALAADSAVRLGSDAGSVARTQADASKHGHDQSLRGTQYSSDSSRTSSQYTADSSRASSQYTADSKLQGDMYTAGASSKRLAYEAKKDAYKEARDAEAHTQKMGFQAQTNARRDTEVFGKDDKKDDAKSDARYNVANEIFEGYGMMDEPSRNAIAPKVKTVLSIFDKVSSRKQMYGAAVNPLNPKSPNHRAMPNYKGATLERQGAGGGYFPGGTKNGYFLRSKEGENIPLGELDASEYALLKHNIATGSWDIDEKGSAK